MAIEGRKVRYAVVGLGYISQVAVLPAFVRRSREAQEPFPQVRRQALGPSEARKKGAKVPKKKSSWRMG
jgi:Family of unknown function (DUF6496)